MKIEYWISNSWRDYNLILISAKENKIDYLINNAGVMLCPNWKTEDDFDMQMGTNHFGHFLFTEIVLPLLKKSATGGFHPRYFI